MSDNYLFEKIYTVSQLNKRWGKKNIIFPTIIICIFITIATTKVSKWKRKRKPSINYNPFKLKLRTIQTLFILLIQGLIIGTLSPHFISTYITYTFIFHPNWKDNSVIFIHSVNLLPRCLFMIFFI